MFLRFLLFYVYFILNIKCSFSLFSINHLPSIITCSISTPEAFYLENHLFRKLAFQKRVLETGLNIPTLFDILWTAQEKSCDTSSGSSARDMICYNRAFLQTILSILTHDLIVILTDCGKRYRAAAFWMHIKADLFYIYISSLIIENLTVYKFKGTDFLRKLADAIVSSMSLNDVPAQRITFQIINKLFQKFSNEPTAFIESLWEKAVYGAIQVIFTLIYKIILDGV